MSAPARNTSARALIALAGFAIAVRLALLFAGPWQAPDRALQADSLRYFVLAENLVRHGTFGKAEEDGIAHLAIERVRASNGTLPAPDANGLRPEGFRTPGYPVFIAAILEALGDRRWILLVQAVLGGLLSVPLVLVSRAAGASQRWALAAGIVWALHPALLVHDNLFLSEGLFNALCVAGVWLAARAGAGSTVAGGLLIGAGALVRPLGLFYLPMALALSWRRDTRGRAAMAVLLVALAAIPSAAWAWRNAHVGEGFRVSTVGDHNLLFYTVPFSIAEERGEEWGQLAGADRLGEELRRRVAPGEDVSSAARRLAIEKIRERPAAVVRVHVKSWAKLMFDHSAPDFAALVGLRYVRTRLFSLLVLREPVELRPLDTGSVVAAALWMSLNVALAAAALFGLVAAVRRRDPVLLATGFTLALFVVATGSVGIERLRVPLLFPMLVLGAAALSPARRARDARAAVAGAAQRGLSSSS